MLPLFFDIIHTILAHNMSNVISPDNLGRGLVSEGALEGILAVYKPWGKTPLQTLDDLRQKYPILADATLSYAGRLDPLAEGLMLVLVGETNKQREQYLKLNKTYEVEILLGIGTDSGDLLGVPTKVSIEDHNEAGIKISSRFSKENIDRVLASFVGKQSFKYPVYSSKTVNGKPLHQWKKEGRIEEIEIPSTNVEIFFIKNSGIFKIGAGEILKKVEKALGVVSGDFRFEEIGNVWREVIDERDNRSRANTQRFSILKIECSCSSGTYMRTLAEEIGKKLDTPALAYSIKRTKIGEIALHVDVAGNSENLTNPNIIYLS